MEHYYELLCGSRVWVAGVKDLHPWTWAQHFQRDIYCNNTNFTEAWAANRRTAALLPLNSKCSQRVEWIWLGMRAAPPKVGWAASPLARAKNKCSPAPFGEGAQLDQVQSLTLFCGLSTFGNVSPSITRPTQWTMGDLWCPWYSPVISSITGVWGVEAVVRLLKGAVRGMEVLGDNWMHR